MSWRLMTFLETSINRNKIVLWFLYKMLITLIGSMSRCPVGGGGWYFQYKKYPQRLARGLLPRTRYSSHGDAPLGSPVKGGPAVGKAGSRFPLGIHCSIWAKATFPLKTVGVLEPGSFCPLWDSSNK